MCWVDGTARYLITDTRINGIDNHPIHCGWEFAYSWFEVGVEEVVGVEGVVEVAEVVGEGVGLASGGELATFDILVELAVAVDEAEGVSHLMEDGGEEVVFTSGWAVGSGGEVGSGSGEFGVVLWCAVDEPADSVGIVVDADGGGVGATVAVVSADGGFG